MGRLSTDSSSTETLLIVFRKQQENQSDLVGHSWLDTSYRYETNVTEQYLTIFHWSGDDTDTEVNNCLSIYHTGSISSRPKSNFSCGNILTKAILFFFSCSEVNSTLLITSKLASQCAQKTLFTCGYILIWVILAMFKIIFQLMETWKHLQ